jgi:hypothetical protein
MPFHNESVTPSVGVSFFFLASLASAFGRVSFNARKVMPLRARSEPIEGDTHMGCCFIGKWFHDYCIPSKPTAHLMNFLRFLNKSTR